MPFGETLELLNDGDSGAHGSMGRPTRRATWGNGELGAHNSPVRHARTVEETGAEGTLFVSAAADLHELVAGAEVTGVKVD